MTPIESCIIGGGVVIWGGGGSGDMGAEGVGIWGAEGVRIYMFSLRNKKTIIIS